MLKNNNILKEHCSQLVLFTSESCNLQCKYCDMASHINRKLHYPEATKVKESLINGQYLETIKRSFERLEIDPEKITSIEIWGQEPTLTLKEFQFFFPQLLNYCNNIKYLFFSTNGVGNIDSILNFIKSLQEIIKEKFTLAIQFSYDGKYQTLKNRGINPEIITNNIINFINELNNIKLNNNFKIIITVHNVIDNNSINYYANEENEDELYNYLKDFSNFSDFYMNLNNNAQVEVRPMSPGIMTPYNASVEDGKNLYKFYKNCERVGSSLQYQNWTGLARQLYERISELDYDTGLKLLQDSTNELKEINLIKLKDFSHRLNCGFNTHTLKVRYDGTLIHCQNALLGLNEEELKEHQEHDKQIQYRKFQKHFYPNILTDSDEIIDNYLYQCGLQNDRIYFAAFAQTSTMLVNLLHAKQVDQKYYNTSEFIKCVYFLTFCVSCPHNAMMQTGLMYGKYAGWIRLLCNGFMDIIQEEYEKTKEKEKEEKLKNDE